MSVGAATSYLRNQNLSKGNADHLKNLLDEGKITHAVWGADHNELLDIGRKIFTVTHKCLKDKLCIVIKWKFYLYLTGDIGEQYLAVRYDQLPKQHEGLFYLHLKVS